MPQSRGKPSQSQDLGNPDSLDRSVYDEDDILNYVLTIILKVATLPLNTPGAEADVDLIQRYIQWHLSPDQVDMHAYACDFMFQRVESDCLAELHGVASRLHTLTCPLYAPGLENYLEKTFKQKFEWALWLVEEELELHFLEHYGFRRMVLIACKHLAGRQRISKTVHPHCQGTALDPTHPQTPFPPPNHPSPIFPHFSPTVPQ
ncbi:uncharacterized protein EI90DRAFT_3123382 [Cantharellus anzutake]|uniref:uncharacterized protein n=1 Tax=Cantharellus anzutake TaxID=1750568 RepID=UPI001905EDFD|nr:uncharacterized protein EI90DRAFT_3123382 [Cantharellus anzutake]KAF8331755.1 hypothetical protein EI90DRAFT_3123382 [Cantharellus anzutake]